MDADKATKLAQEALIDAHSHFNFGQVKSVAHAILTACEAEAADCDARVQADRERCAEIAYRHFALQHISAMDCATQIRGEMCPGPTDALEAKLREARLEVADDILRVLVAGEDKKCAEVVSWLMRYIDDLAALKGAK